MANYTQISDMVKLFKTLANDKRIRILRTIQNQEMRVSNIASLLNIQVVTASCYLNKMRYMGFVKARQDGVDMYYSIADKMVSKVLDIF